MHLCFTHELYKSGSFFEEKGAITFMNYAFWLTIYTWWTVKWLRKKKVQWQMAEKTFTYQTSVQKISISPSQSCSNLIINTLKPRRKMIFSFWAKNRLKCFEDLFINNAFASFSELSSSLNLPSSHLFRYFQSRHWSSVLWVSLQTYKVSMRGGISTESSCGGDYL